jgi:hypothetical protein
MLFALASCAETGEPYYRPIAEADYPSGEGPGEKLYPGERDAAARIAAIIHAHMLRRYGSGQVRRDAHPKSHGCLEASFTVPERISVDTLRQGLFEKPGTYPAIIRFSNSNEDPSRPDFEKDGRGMAIKVLNVPGAPPAQPPGGPPAQDFIMINYPTFLVAKPADYVELVGYTDSPDMFTQWLQPVLVLSAIGIRGTINAALATSSVIDDPLNTRYWSMVPYQLGAKPAQAVKYSAMPCMQSPINVPKTKDPNYLRATMRARLAQGSACMKLMVQLRTSETMSVEDSVEEWPETLTSFVEVARLTIPAQDFDTPSKNAACESMSYSPWNALDGHTPLGAVNRMRKAIYQNIATLRQETTPK